MTSAVGKFPLTNSCFTKEQLYQFAQVFYWISPVRKNNPPKETCDHKYVAKIKSMVDYHLRSLQPLLQKPQLESVLTALLAQRKQHPRNLPIPGNKNFFWLKPTFPGKFDYQTHTHAFMYTW